MNKKIFYIALFIIYILCLLDIFLFKMYIPPKTGIYNEINLIPFYGDNFKIFGSLLHILAFIPFGIYLGIIATIILIGVLGTVILRQVKRSKTI